MTEFNFLS